MSAVRRYNWNRQELVLEDIREREEHQVRAGGVSHLHVNTLVRAMGSEGDRTPISVAKVGKAHYVIDGFHRLAAARKLGWSHISADVARMSAGEARGYALLANTKHGKNLGRHDKDRIFDEYVAQGGHVGADGVLKASRVIQAELNHIYSHETIRQKLKKRGIEIDLSVEFPGGYKPFKGGWDDEDDEADAAALAYRLTVDAQAHLDAFGSLFFDVDDHAKHNLLDAARDLVDRLGRGERPIRVDGGDVEGLLDI